MKAKRIGLFGLLSLSVFGLSADKYVPEHGTPVYAEEAIEETPPEEKTVEETPSEEVPVEEKKELTDEEKKELLEKVFGEELTDQIFKVVNGEEDWTEIFTFKNIMSFVLTVLNGGLLIAMVKYFIKDKRIANTVESAVKATVAKLVPEQTQAAVATAMETAISPLFVKFVETSANTSEAVKTLSKCFVLAQEGTPESRIAIVNELSKINVDDNKLVCEVRDCIMQATEKLKKEMEDRIASLNAIQETNEKIIEEHNNETNEETEKEVVNTYDGTSI